MYQSQINVRYAKALFQLSIEKTIEEEIIKDIKLIYSFFEEINDLKILVENPVIKSDQKIKILNSLFKDKLNKYTVSFLNLIVKNKRESYLKGVCQNYIDLFRQYKGIKQAIITTAFDLPEKERMSIQKSIQKKFNSVIELQSNVDEALLGGMVIQIEDKQLDLSVAKQIQRLKKRFLSIDFNKED